MSSDSAQYLYNHFVTREMCERWRELHDDGQTAKEIADGQSVSGSTVCRHLRGECSHQSEWSR